MKRNIFRNLMTAVTLAALLLPATAFAQGKLTGHTRLILAEKEGKLSTEVPQDLRGRGNTTTILSDGGVVTQPAFENSLPTASPVTIDGVRMVQCWIDMTDKNYSAIEHLGVKIQNKFDGCVTALVPVAQIDKVAALSNVTKVDAARKLKKHTYVSRLLTNVDDVLNLTSDAQTAGLLQAYNGSGVVLGVIDTGIDFAHPMFSGRNMKKYVYDSNRDAVIEYTGSSAKYTDETHGTHTSSIAGGSDYTATAYVYTTSTSYSTVSNAKFGGMAPGTDLVLCDLGEELLDTHIATSIKYIHDYAESVGKPYVINLSLGGHFGPHDGTGHMAEVCAQYTGPGKIIIFAAGNEGEDGIYHYKNASASSPAMTVLSSQTRSSYSVDYGVALSYARTPNVELAVRYYVVNTSRNTILWTSNEITTDDYFVDDDGNIELYGAEISVNDTGSDGTTKLSTYFTAYQNDSDKYGYLCGYLDKDSYNGKWYVETILYYLKPVSSSYKIGMSVYPKNGSCYVDSWPAVYIDFASSSASVNGNTFTAGGNDCSISDEGTFPSVISVGSYCSSKYWRAGTTSASNQVWTNNGTYQQISMFSSYCAPNAGPTGQKLPWITAPGEVIIAAYNSGYSAESNIYYAYGTNKKLGAMSGTSMAAPCTAGITALWLQANPSLTPDQVKTVMAETAIKDSYVNGTYASHFGNGKIDALAGIKYILEQMSGPTLTATPTTVSFTNGIKGQTYTQDITISGSRLEGNVTATLSGANVFTINKSSIAKATAEAGTTITVTYAPTAAGTQNATLTLSSQDAESVVINITGTATVPTLTATPTAITFDPTEAGSNSTKTFTVQGSSLTGNVSLAVSGNVFSVSPTSLTAAQAMEGATITVTFAPTAIESYSGSITLSSQDADNVTVTLNGEGTKAYPESFDVEIGSYGLTTFYLDYPVIIPYDTYDDLLGVYYLYDISDNEARMARIRTIVPANQGVVVQGNSGTYTFPRYKGSDVPKLTRPNYLMGSVEDITPDEALAAADASSDAFIMTMGMGSNGYIGFYTYSGNKLAANKAFLIYEPNGSSSANALSIGGIGMGDFTAITEIDNAEAQGTWHTLQGAKLNGRPSQKGIYIHNGKAVVVK